MTTYDTPHARRAGTLVARHLPSEAAVRHFRGGVRLVTNRLVNPIVRGLIERDRFPAAWSLLETTGRRSGRARRTPIGNGLRGNTFWIVTEHGRHADYVRNIEADPRVRVKVGRRWRSGRARILADDDPYARLRWLRRPVNDAALLTVGTEQLTIRVDLDP